MRKQFWLAISMMCLAAIGCGKDSPQQSSETATSGTFQLVADETLKPVIDSLITGFLTENSNAAVSVKYVSAGEAVRELLNRQARAIIITRGLTPRERTVIANDSTPLPDLLIAEDGIGCLMSAKNPLAVVRLSDLRNMATGTLSKWDDIHSPVVEPGEKLSGTVEMVLPEYPSSTEYLLDSLSGTQPDTAGHAAHTGPRRRFASTDSIVAYVKAHPNAIGFIGSSWKHAIEASGGDVGVKIVPVIPFDSSSHGLTEPVLLNMAYVYEGIYPLALPVNGFSWEAPNTLPRGFLSYAMTAHGQMVFKNFEVLPKTQIIHIVPPKP